MASRWAPSSGNARQDDGKESGGLGTGVVQVTEFFLFFKSFLFGISRRVLSLFGFFRLMGIQVFLSAVKRRVRRVVNMARKDMTLSSVTGR